MESTPETSPIAVDQEILDLRSSYVEHFNKAIVPMVIVGGIGLVDRYIPSGAASFGESLVVVGLFLEFGRQQYLGWRDFRRASNQERELFSSQPVTKLP